METMVAAKTLNEIATGELTQELYEKAFLPVAKFVRNMGGSLDDARDIFHDALVAYCEMQIPLNVSPVAYILGIAKHLWIRKYHRTKAFVSLSDMEMQIQLPADFFITVNSKRLVRFLESAGKRCMDLLRAFYHQNKQLKTLVHSMGFSNEHSASAQKYKCLEKVREMVKQKSLVYDDFLE